VAGGMLFPINVLPDWLQIVAKLNPVTYALDAMRDALLGAEALHALWRPLIILLLFAAALLPLSMLVFAWALHRTKATGTLMHR
jgi:ABC-2 type transport system permease protein